MNMVESVLDVLDVAKPWEHIEDELIDEDVEAVWKVLHVSEEAYSRHSLVWNLLFQGLVH